MKNDRAAQGRIGNGTMGKGKTALVAGGAGFIGSHLTDALLRDGFRVIVLDNYCTGQARNLAHLVNEPQLEMLEPADVMEPLPSALFHPSLKIDYIYNLACPASPVHYQADPEHTLMTSVLGTRNLLRLAEKTGARFLLASTSEVYGDPDVHPQAESYWGNVNSTGPRACYDEGKRAAETLTFDFARAGRADVRVVRIFNTYGPRMRTDDGRVVSNFINQALSGEDITIFGSGSQTRSFCYVDDLVVGLQGLMSYEGDYRGPVNIGNPHELTIADLVGCVLHLTRSQSKIVEQPLPIDDPRRRRPNIELARQLLGWEPTVDLESGLKRTIAYFEALKNEQTYNSKSDFSIRV